MTRVFPFSGLRNLVGGEGVEFENHPGVAPVFSHANVDEICRECVVLHETQRRDQRAPEGTQACTVRAIRVGRSTGLPALHQTPLPSVRSDSDVMSRRVNACGTAREPRDGTGVHPNHSAPDQIVVGHSGL